MTATPTPEARPTREARGVAARRRARHRPRHQLGQGGPHHLTGAGPGAGDPELPGQTPRTPVGRERPRGLAPAIIAAVREVAREGHRHTPIVGIGLSGQMHGVTVTDDQLPPAPAGDPVGRCPGRRPARPVHRAAHEPAGRPAEPPDPGDGGPDPGLAQPAREPRPLERTRWALQPKDWVRAWLTGQAAAEPSDASATLLYDIPADTWALDIAAALGIDPGSAAAAAAISWCGRGHPDPRRPPPARPRAGDPGRRRRRGHRGRGPGHRPDPGRHRSADHRHRRPGHHPCRFGRTARPPAR